MSITGKGREESIDLLPTDTNITLKEFIQKLSDQG